MSTVRIIPCIFCLLFLAQGANTQDNKPEAMVGISQAYYSMFDSDNPFATKEMLNHVRRERFDLILPRVMRENKIDGRVVLNV